MERCKINLVFETLFSTLFTLFFLQHSCHHVQHVSQAVVAAVLHKNLGKPENKLGLSCAKLSKLMLDTHQVPARVLIMSWYLAMLLP